MSLARIEGDFHVTGRISSGNLTIPASTISDAAVASDAAIAATKVSHDVRKTYSQEAAANAAADNKVIHVARNSGTVAAFECGLITAPDTAPGSSGRTATFDLKKNNTTILSGTVQLDSTNTARVVEAGTISSAAYVDGDVFQVVITVGGSAGTHALGIFCEASFREVAA
jgi:hypothetical protein